MNNHKTTAKTLCSVRQFEACVREENQKSKMFSDDVIYEMCLNIRSIYNFHRVFLLPELQRRLTEW